MEPEATDQETASFSSWGLILMVSILVVAAMLSALTAMRFAIRGREVVVPPLVGKTQAEAQKTLEDQGLQLKVSTKRFSSEIAEGRVVEQIPSSGTHLKTNRSVKVLLSLGDRKYAVPNLIGTSLRAAQLTLSQRRLSLGNTLYAHTPEGEPETVVYQSPSGGSQEGNDPTVHILISLGPTEQYFTMPDLIGQPAELASSRARAEGFKVAKPTPRKYPGVGPGVVIQQKPQAGYRISKSDLIVLDVSQ